METVKSYSTSKNRTNITSITIGGFDGMHKAHQELFKNLDSNGAIVVIDSGYANLTQKRNRQAHTSIPIYYYMLENIKHLTGELFIKLLQKEFPNLKKIVVGFDFGFGKDRKHNVKDLISLFNKEVKVIQEIKVDNIAVHSRIIREYLKKGDIKTANNLLGRNYEIQGSHVQGQGIGKSSFVPTINVIVNDFLLPKDGVYITKTSLNNKEYNSITFIGNRATTDNKYAVETHILDEDIKNHNNLIKIAFLKKVRDNKKFNSYKELKSQIILDIQKTKNYF